MAADLGSGTAVPECCDVCQATAVFLRWKSAVPPYPCDHDFESCLRRSVAVVQIWRQVWRSERGVDVPLPFLRELIDTLLFWRHDRWLAWMNWVRALLLAAGQPGTPPPVAFLASDRRPASDLTPAVAVLRARTVLTAGPPRSRVPVLAGAAA
jgi:hypothetical protein